MSIIISNMSIPPGCQKCKFFKKHLFGNGLDYSYSCILGAKDFPMPWIRQMEERASDCPIEPLEQTSVLDEIRAEITNRQPFTLCILSMGEEYERGIDDMMNQALMIIDKHKVESEDKGIRNE